jgi:biopolymer transport protein ExbD
VTVDVDASGRYVVNSADVGEKTVEAITLALRKAAGEGKDPTIVINADAASTHQSVVNVMEAARQAGYTHITFATQVKSGP